MRNSASCVDRTALSKHAGDWLRRLASHLEKALASGDVDAVHGLRVASRRLTEPLLLMEAVIGRKPVRRARKNLRRVRDAFQVVRDVDVLMLALHAPQTPCLLEAESVAALDAELALLRTAALDTARAVCERVNVVKLAARIKALIEPVGAADDETAASLCEALHDMLRCRAAAVLESDPRRMPDADVHEARIAVKRLRYCAELLVKLDSSWDASRIAPLTEFQRLLGDWNDHVVAAEWVARPARKRDNLARRTGWSARLLEYAAARARIAAEQRGVILERWPELEAAVQIVATPCGEAATPLASNDSTERG